MNSAPTLSREDFEQLLAEHLRLIERTGDLEYQLHVLAGNLEENSVRQCQHTAGALVRLLREHLFRQDQIVLPILDRLCTETAPPADQPTRDACCAGNPTR